MKPKNTFSKSAGFRQVIVLVVVMLAFTIASFALSSTARNEDSDDQVTISGELRQLHAVTFEEKIWPKGIEYQIKYDHTTGENYTGDVWNSVSSFDRVAGPENSCLPIEEGAVPQERKSGEYKCLADAKFNALNDQWNQCENIVMGDEYSIHKSNGQVVNVITNLAHKQGTIGLKAKTAKIIYRDVKIMEFEESIPVEKF